MCSIREVNSVMKAIQTLKAIIEDIRPIVIVHNVMVTYLPESLNNYLITDGLIAICKSHTYPSSLESRIGLKFSGYPYLCLLNLDLADNQKYLVKKKLEKITWMKYYLSS